MDTSHLLDLVIADTQDITEDTDMHSVIIITSPPQNHLGRAHRHPSWQKVWHLCSITLIESNVLIIITRNPQVIWEEPCRRPSCTELTRLLHATSSAMPTVDESNH